MRGVAAFGTRVIPNDAISATELTKRHEKLYIYMRERERERERERDRERYRERERDIGRLGEREIGR